MNLDENIHKINTNYYNKENDTLDPQIKLNYNEDKNQKENNDNSIAPNASTPKSKSFSSFNKKKKEKNIKYDKTSNKAFFSNDKGKKINIYSNVEENKNLDSIDRGSENSSKNSSELSSYSSSNNNNNINNNNNEKKLSKIIDFSSDSNENKKVINFPKKNLFKSRNTMQNFITQPNNLIFPPLSNKHLFSLKKNEIFNKEFLTDDKFKVNDLINKKITLNNNSIFVSDPKSKKFSIFQRFNEDKVKYQQSVGFSLLRNKANNNIYSTQFLTYSNGDKYSYSRNISESIDKKETTNFEYNNISNSKESFSNYSCEKKKFNKDINKRKSSNITAKYNFFENDKEKNKIDKYINQCSIERISNSIHLSKKRIINLNKNNKDSISISRRSRIRLSSKLSLNKKNKEILTQSKEINENNNNDNNINNEIDKFKSPFRRVRKKKLTNVYKNNFHFFNNLLDRKYKIYESTKNIRSTQKRHTIMEISKIINNNINNKKTFFANSLINNRNNFSLINKRNINKNYFENDIIISRSESLNNSEKDESNENTVILQNKKSSFHFKYCGKNSNLCKIEEKYIKKKRLKIIKQVELKNKSSFLYNTYTEELKNYFLKNCAVDKITENIFKNFEPLDIRIKSRGEIEEEIEKCMKELFVEQIKKSHKYCYSFDKIIKLGKSYIKEKKIKTLVKVTDNYILEKFFVYQELLKNFRMKWKNLSNKESYYNKIINFFKDCNNYVKRLDKKQKIIFLDNFNKIFYICTERIRRDIDFNMNLLHLRVTHKNKTDKNKKSKFIPRKRESSFKTDKKFRNHSRSIFKEQNNILFSLRKRNLSPKGSFNFLKRASEDASFNTKLMNFIKIQKEFGFSKRTESFEKFAKLYRISTMHSSKNIKKKINEEKIINSKTINNEFEKKMMDFIDIKNNINNFNILKNKKVFHYNNNRLSSNKKNSKIINLKKNKIQLDHKLKIETMTIKFAGIGQLTKEASLIKTQEMEKDSPDAKLFDVFVSLLQKRKIYKFENLMKKENEIFNRIINKQEFSTGNTLLFYATLNNLKPIVELLLKKGSDPNLQNKFGNSPLHIAYKNDNPFMINLLLENGSNQKLKNCKGLLPWQLSKYIN